MLFNFKPNNRKKKSLGKVVFQILVTWCFLRKFIFWPPFWNKTFLIVLLLIYGYFRCSNIWCKFRTEISTGEYSKMDGSKWNPLCVQTGVKSNLRTCVKSEYPSAHPHHISFLYTDQFSELNTDFPSKVGIFYRKITQRYSKIGFSRKCFWKNKKTKTRRLFIAKLSRFKWLFYSN